MLTGDTNSSSYNLTHLYPLFATIKGQEDVYSSCCDFWNSLGVIPNSSLKQVVKYFRLKYPNVAATSVTLLSLSSNMCLACFILMFRIKSNGVRPVMAFNLRVKVERDIFMASARAVTSKSGSVRLSSTAFTAFSNRSLSSCTNSGSGIIRKSKCSRVSK